jgi:hypothetical protein
VCYACWKKGSWFIEKFTKERRARPKDQQDAADNRVSDLKLEYPRADVTIHIVPCNEGCTQCGSFCTFYKKKSATDDAGN